MEPRKPVTTRQLFDDYETWKKGALVGHPNFVPTRNDRIAWTPLEKPLRACRIVLLSTCGVHRKDQLPFNTEADTEDKHGDWSYRAIPSDTPADMLAASHVHFNTNDANEDINCVFPIDRIRELCREGALRDMTETHYGLMGFIPNPKEFLRTTCLEIADRIRAEKADIALLTPG